MQDKDVSFSVPETEEILEKIALKAPSIDECEFVELSDEEYEDNMSQFVMTREQFRFHALTIRTRVTSAVGECMQLIEITNLTPEAQRAMKSAVKRSIWGAAKDIISGMADISDISAEEKHETLYGKNEMFV